jgi:predicted chitinase
MLYDRKKFFDKYRKQFGALHQTQVEGLEYLLSRMERDYRLTLPEQHAYMLATVSRETKWSFQPIKEGTSRGEALRKVTPTDAQVIARLDRALRMGIIKRYYWPKVNGNYYFGRGDVQITFPDNYQRLGIKLGIDLYGHPDLALDPFNAYNIMSVGMADGLFTGHSLIKYINNIKCDFVYARQVVNRMDAAAEIAVDARKFLICLT